MNSGGVRKIGNVYSEPERTPTGNALFELIIRWEDRQLTAIEASHDD